MIRLLIADDEEDTRLGIRSLVPWEANGISICAEARNGKEALERIEQTNPDIILVDIRMPLVDGLSVIETLYSRGSSVKSIILSGYDDFAYAQKALKFGASDYLLKPCTPQKILETVLNIKAQIDDEREKAARAERLMQQYRDSLPLLKERYLIQHIENPDLDKSNIQQNFTNYQIALSSNDISVAVIRVDNIAELRRVKTSTEIELLLLAIIELFSASIDPMLHHEFIRFSGDLVLILNTATEAQKSSFYKALTLTKNMVADRLDHTLSIGVSGFGHNASDLHAAYAHALDALEFQYFSGSNAIVSYDEIRAYAINKTFYPLDMERTLLNRIVSGQDEGVADQLDDFMNALKQNNASSDQYKKASLALMFSVYHACIENNIDTDQIFGSDLSALDDIAAIDKISSLRTQLLGLLESSAQRFARTRNVNSYMEMILRFIDEKYADEISLESIASEVFITPGYVSILFKQVLGINFVDYLQKVRSKKACELLADVRLKIYDISCKVGYKDEKYFSQVFRKNIGMTPTEYRKMIQKR